MAQCPIKNIIYSSYNNFLNKENVVGLAPGTKICNNIDTCEQCITVFVTKKVSASNLSPSARIPSVYKNMKTDVIQIGEINAAAYIEKIRPMLFGYSISPIDAFYSGTAGCIVADKDNKYILSNNHVLANVNDTQIGTSIIQPSLSNGGNPETDVVAELSKFVPIQFGQGDDFPINYVDAAIAKIIDESKISNEIASIGEVSGLNSKANAGTLVKKAGRTSELTYGKILYTGAMTFVNYGVDKIALFDNQIMTTKMIAPGDSGSVLLDDNNFLVGLGFAGSEEISIFNPINTVFKELQITVI